MIEVNWAQLLLNNAAVLITALGVIWRIGVKITSTTLEVIEDNREVKMGMQLVQKDIKAMEGRIEHLEKNMINSQNLSQNILVNNIIQRLDRLEAVVPAR